MLAMLRRRYPGSTTAKRAAIDVAYLDGGEAPDEDVTALGYISKQSSGNARGKHNQPERCNRYTKAPVAPVLGKRTYV